MLIEGSSVVYVREGSYGSFEKMHLPIITDQLSSTYQLIESLCYIDRQFSYIYGTFLVLGTLRR